MPNDNTPEPRIAAPSQRPAPELDSGILLDQQMQGAELGGAQMLPEPPPRRH